MRTTERLRRDHRLQFDCTTQERRAIFDAAAASGLDVAPWCRFILLAAARNANRDSNQHPTDYPVVQHPPRAQATADTKPTPPAQPLLERADTKPVPPTADTKPSQPQRKSRRWEPYGDPVDPEDSDGLDSPEAIVVPGLGSARFK